MVSSSRVKQTWKICRLLFFRAAVLFGVYILVLFIPKPDWVCKNDLFKYRRTSFMTSGTIKTLDENSLEAPTLKPLHHVIDPHVKRMLQLFPVYLEENLTARTRQSQSDHSSSQVNIFHLQNFNFSHFGRTWLNTVAEHELHPQEIEESVQNQSYSDLVLKKLKHQKLPDCVKLKVPHGATRTKICVHYPQHDNFISNRLRDTGVWELELVFQMEEFFRKTPRSQLIDLGCNVGVFTLFAASMAKPVLAVDILPSNLALIQLSIAINDENMEQANDEDAVELQRLLGYARKSSARYSDLITTVHNAIYSKRAQMYVYLKEDLNLGGTEVKEVNIQQENTQPNYLKEMVNTAAQSNQREQADRITNVEDNPNTTKGNTIFVNAICLDDLIPFVRANLSVFLKMDVEGFEPNVFLCAGDFFMHVDVRVILMEVLFHRHSDQGKVMVNFLLRHNMVPSEDVNGRKLLATNLDTMYTWPENIFWIKVR